VHISLSRPYTPLLFDPTRSYLPPFLYLLPILTQPVSGHLLLTELFYLWSMNIIWIFCLFGAKNSIRLRVRLKTQSALLRRPRVHSWTLPNQNTSNKIGNFDKTVLASEDASILRRKKNRTSSFNFAPIGYSQLIKRLKMCWHDTKKNDWKKKTWKSDIIGSLIINQWPKNSYGIKSLKNKKSGPK
jgi:hypothetical protein